jgi:spore maturation protein CgeB
MRLYESTGVGTMLLTDYKDNLHTLFGVDTEVAVYHNAQDCLGKIDYYLTHEKERQQLAEAGQHRTLNEHTYHHRMQEFVEIIKPYL